MRLKTTTALPGRYASGQANVDALKQKKNPPPSAQAARRPGTGTLPSSAPNLCNARLAFQIQQPALLGPPSFLPFLLFIRGLDLYLDRTFHLGFASSPPPLTPHTPLPISRENLPSPTHLLSFPRASLLELFYGFHTILATT